MKSQFSETGAYLKASDLDITGIHTPAVMLAGPANLEDVVRQLNLLNRRMDLLLSALTGASFVELSLY